ncbi:MAG TPA: serine hydrolase domain-containing protein [Chthoniobacter sp.]|nr:serine hydrolase domain-containing protein [Chthoniobacter sp.]
MPSESVDFSRTLALAEQGLRDRLHIGAQLYVSRHGQVLLDQAIGEARAGVPMTPDMLMIWMSASKPLTAVLILQLWEQGKLELDDPIAKHIPEFGQGGKDAVTIRHALTHTGGFRGIASRMDALPWDDAIKMICEQRIEPNWVPGKKAGYHIGSSWYILGELVGRIQSGDQWSPSSSGGQRPMVAALYRQLLDSIGMRNTSLGMTPGYFAQIQPRVGIMHQTDGGTVRPHPSLDSEAATVPPRPGSNARGPIRELGRFYEMLLNRGEGVLTSQTVDAMTAHQRVGLLDQTFRLHLDWGLGVIVNSPHEDYQKFSYGFGPHASMRAFGHGGNQSSLGMADPEHGLVVATVFNGMPGAEAHAARMRSLMAAIYEDVGISRSE